MAPIIPRSITVEAGSALFDDLTTERVGIVTIDADGEQPVAVALSLAQIECLSTALVALEVTLNRP